MDFDFVQILFISNIEFSPKEIFMKKILVSVDFSDCSRNAFFYAKSLAARMGYGLKVVHVYTGNLNPKVPRTLQM